ncbi:MAG: 50S ribosomal protein L29 [Fimbriimonadales bacterium]|nr:MAG: 50S ribosomal protein L29 [Armatimonadota bacterium]MBV6502646.1 50S ribosomal protein L29 [Fimbriimonadales bacterium]MCE7898507.1 50S ribosomal protein L29 [Armatimonadetes bacterium ATM1]MDL1928200.1 50S ribosomal protein L29 [Fimbriimonadia bacterium ATM]MBC6968654.1 50S ribosomal protein L29 [Armatimonadota bacterium]
MKELKAKELRNKSVDELAAMLKKEELALFNLRRQLGFREIKDTTSQKVQRHNIARIKTVLTEKGKGAN